MTKSIKFAGHDFDLYTSGVLFLREYGVMIVSDLHLEKGSHFGAMGLFLPPYDTQDTLERLTKCAESLNPKKIIFLGDIFHDSDSFNRMSLDNIDRLYTLLKQYEIIWIEGNHDAGFSPPNVDMRIEYAYLNLNFRHIATDNEDFEISGHYHPAVTIRHKNDKTRRRCFIHDKTKMILPSFGSYTGGLDVTDPAIKTLFRSEMKVYPIGKDKVYKLKSTAIK